VLKQYFAWLKDKKHEIVIDELDVADIQVIRRVHLFFLPATAQ
jgi:hypothetical protein